MKRSPNQGIGATALKGLCVCGCLPRRAVVFNMFMDVLLFALGLITGGAFVLLWKKSKTNSLEMQTKLMEKENSRLLQDNEARGEKEKQHIETSARLQAEKESLQNEIQKQERNYREKTDEMEQRFTKELSRQKSHYEELAGKAPMEFENIAQKILLKTTETYREESTKDLSLILRPFREDLEGFKKSVQDFESKERFLKDTIQDFKGINSKMQEETLKLRQTLHGDTRTQGEWGELVLENILEKSGLRKGEEFIVQGKGLDLKDKDDGSLRPDVIVKLPENKHIVIDSKASLMARHQEFLSAGGEEEREQARQKLINSLSGHIDDLSSKDYSSSKGLKTPDFVLMFIPSEGVFSLATQAKQGLFEKAWKKSIAIVSPTTLYATLRTIASIWKMERQNKNAEKIAREGGLLYDKFVNFLEDMNQIEKGLEAAKKSYDQARNRLETGRGNLIQKTERMKKLGLNPRKEIPSNFLKE